MYIRPNIEETTDVSKHPHPRAQHNPHPPTQALALAAALDAEKGLGGSDASLASLLAHPAVAAELQRRCVEAY